MGVRKVATAPVPAARFVRGDHPRGGLPSGSSPLDFVADVQRRAGNAAVSRVLQRQPAPPPPAPTPKSIDAALKSISQVSSTTTQVTSLRPWEIFKTLPWNPSDGGKKRLYSALKKAHLALRKARAALAEAQLREAAVTAAPAPAPNKSKKRAKVKAKHVTTAAEAQDAVDKAQAKVDTATADLKSYVKNKLDTERNPFVAPLRREKADAAADLRSQQASIRAAERKKKPDRTLIADLTKKRDAARARVDKAVTAVADKVTALRAEIDASDWSPQAVGQTVAVYEVAGARATLTDRVDAYATVTASGLEGSAARVGAGGPTVPELLAKDPTLGVSTRKILAIISRFEGSFSALNTWDIADVTFGMVQWTTGASGHGDLIRALRIMKQAAPAAFADRLTKYGIDVADTGLVLTRPDGSVLTGVPAAKAVQADPKLAAVLSAAGTDPELQAAELRAANEIEVSGALTSRLSVHFPPAKKGGKAVDVRIPVSSLMTSEFGVGVLANHTVHGGFPGGDLAHAANAFVASHHVAAADVATWAPACEADLIAAISTGGDAERISVMKKELSGAAGSFN